MDHPITWGEFLLLLIAFGGPAWTVAAGLQQVWLRRSARAGVPRRVAALAGGALLLVPLTVAGMYVTTLVPAARVASRRRR